MRYVKFDQLSYEHAYKENITRSYCGHIIE